MGLKSAQHMAMADEQREAIKSLSLLIRDQLFMLEDASEAANSDICLCRDVNLAIVHLRYCLERLSEMGF